MTLVAQRMVEATSIVLSPEDAASADRRYASRKFLFAMAVWVAATIGWFTSFIGWWVIDTEQYLSFSKWVLGLYIAGNLGDTMVTPVASKVTTSTTTTT